MMVPYFSLQNWIFKKSKTEIIFFLNINNFFIYCPTKVMQMSNETENYVLISDTTTIILVLKMYF